MAGILKNKIVLYLLIFIPGSFFGQKFTWGVTYTAFSASQMKFDQQYIILNQYDSYKIGPQNFHYGITTLLNVFNSGLFFNYDYRHCYAKAELNFQENSFCYWDPITQRVPENASFDNFFAYSCMELPVSFGIKLNRSRKIKPRLFGGITCELGESTFGNVISLLPINQTTDHAINSEMISRMKSANFYAHAGVGAEFYSNFVELRFEQSISNFNKVMDPYNANIKSVSMIHCVFGFTFSQKSYASRRFTREINKEKYD